MGIFDEYTHADVNEESALATKARGNTKGLQNLLAKYEQFLNEVYDRWHPNVQAFFSNPKNAEICYSDRLTSYAYLHLKETQFTANDITFLELESPSEDPHNFYPYQSPHDSFITACIRIAYERGESTFTLPQQSDHHALSFLSGEKNRPLTIDVYKSAGSVCHVVKHTDIRFRQSCECIIGAVWESRCTFESSLGGLPTFAKKCTFIFNDPSLKQLSLLKKGEHEKIKGSFFYAKNTELLDQIRGYVPFNNSFYLMRDDGTTKKYGTNTYVRSLFRRGTL